MARVKVAVRILDLPEAKEAVADLTDRAEKAEAAIERARHLHRRLPWPECHLDGESWPCRTIRELDGMEATDG